MQDSIECLNERQRISNKIAYSGFNAQFSQVTLCYTCCAVGIYYAVHTTFE